MKQIDTKHVTGYLDLPSSPEFPFGFGLSYTTFDYSDLKVAPVQIQSGDTVTVSATVTNSGSRHGGETVQLYIRDLVASMPQPVRALKAFRKIRLAPGEHQIVEFKLSSEDLAFHNREMKRVSEPGRFRVWIGGDSTSGPSGEFELK